MTDWEALCALLDADLTFVDDRWLSESEGE